jgi:replicative DNA helicase
MSIYTRVVQELETNKKLREEGKHINIPFPFQRFSKYIPGIQKGRYVLVTANSKVGKSKITDNLFVYNPFFTVRNTHTDIRLKVLYFSLEMSKEEKIKEAMSYFLYRKSKGRIREAPEVLSSQFEDYILEDHLLKEIQDLDDVFKDFESKVEFIDDIRNPTGIYNYVRNYAQSHGEMVTKKVTWDVKDDEGNKYQEEKVLNDHYVPYDPDEYVIIVIDHASLITPERINGQMQSLQEAMANLSSNYLVKMRNTWGYTPVLIQQQAAASESVENMKFKKLQPSLEGLGDSKVVGRDPDLILGLFSPFRHRIKDYEGYDITRLKDNHRELTVIANRRGPAVSTNLYFDGAVNHFSELPPVGSVELAMLYDRIEKGAVK